MVVFLVLSVIYSDLNKNKSWYYNNLKNLCIKVMRKVKHISRYIMLMRTCRGNVLNHLEKNITIQDNRNAPRLQCKI